MNEKESRPIPKAAWDAPPPPRRRLSVPIVVPVPDRSLELIALAARVEVVNVHYTDGRSCPCCDPLAACPACEAGQVPRREGYLACVLRHAVKPVCLRLTYHALESCPALLESAQPLRGLLVVAKRIRPKPRAPIVVSLAPLDRLEAGRLPAAFDVRKLLEQVWEAPARDPKRPPRSAYQPKGPIPY